MLSVMSHPEYKDLTQSTRTSFDFGGMLSPKGSHINNSGFGNTKQELLGAIS